MPWKVQWDSAAAGTRAGLERAGKKSYWPEEGEEAGDARAQGPSATREGRQAAVSLVLMKHASASLKVCSLKGHSTQVYGFQALNRVEMLWPRFRCCWKEAWAKNSGAELWDKLTAEVRTVAAPQCDVRGFENSMAH